MINTNVKLLIKNLLVLPCLLITATLLLSSKANAITFVCTPSGMCVPTFTVQPCLNNPSNTCTVLAAFDNKQGSSWFVNYDGSGNVTSTDGIGNTPFYISINGVYQYTLHTNNSNSPGAAVVVAPAPTNFTFGPGPNSNSGGRGYCKPANPTYPTENATVPFNAGGHYNIYSVVVGYSCPNF